MMINDGFEKYLIYALWFWNLKFNVVPLIIIIVLIVFSYPQISMNKKKCNGDK
jgi:hypothetical protein